tara:strand:- start:19500 stop:20780 length:1281 start_codon:yes stop_codon:yes gene_type:complete
MVPITNFKKLSFLVYGLGLTGRSVVNFFKKNNIKNYEVWDDKNKNLYKERRPSNLNEALKKVDYIVLSPGVNIKKIKNKLPKYKKKIITDIDLIFLVKNFYKSIVVTGTNGKSTTCKIIAHLLKKNGFKIVIGGNIGTPVLDLKVNKNAFLIIEVSSFQLAYSKNICPDYAMLLNITNDHLDWHGNMKNYKDSKFKIFELQNRNQYSFVNKKLKKEYKKRNFLGKLIIPEIKKYKKTKFKMKNSYLKSEINDENMSYVFELSKILKIDKNDFLESLKTCEGLPHRYEIFYKKNNCTFINDSKATSFQATKFALKNSKNIYWIVGGLPKKNDKIILSNLKKNIVKAYIIGKNISFFNNQLKNQIKCYTAKNLKKSIIKIFSDIKIYNKKYNIILFSPASASFDQFLNFEKRGEKFKELIKFYGRKYI